jgi:hypothetical protein
MLKGSKLHNGSSCPMACGHISETLPTISYGGTTLHENQVHVDTHD